MVGLGRGSYHRRGGAGPLAQGVSRTRSKFGIWESLQAGSRCEIGRLAKKTKVGPPAAAPVVILPGSGNEHRVTERQSVVPHGALWPYPAMDAWPAPR